MCWLAPKLAGSSDLAVPLPNVQCGADPRLITIMAMRGITTLPRVRSRRISVWSGCQDLNLGIFRARRPMLTIL